MPKKQLSARFVDRAPVPASGRVEYWDTREPGFVLRVKADGGKTYCAVGRVNGKRTRYTIGLAKDYELTDAREKAKEALSAMRRGENPLAEKRRQEVAPDRRFGAVVDQFLKLYAKPNQKPRTYEETERNLTRYFVNRQPPSKLPPRTVKKAQAKRRKVEPVPYWKDRAIDEITKADVIARLDEIARHHGPTHANRCLAALRKFYNWAISSRDLLEHSPCDRLPAPNKERKRKRHFHDTEIKPLWQAASIAGHPFGTLLKFLILTGQRRTEVAAMRWREIDKEGRLWIIPPARTKNGVPHVVPLSKQALAVLNGITRTPDAEEDFVFTTDGESHVSGFSKGLARMVKAAELSEPWSFHTCRHTVRTHLGSLGIADTVIRKTLNHAVPGVSDQYDHYGYLKEKRHALKAWGAKVERLVTAKAGSNVSELRPVA